MCDWRTAEKSVYNLLRENAKSNRASMTPAESAFWQIAKANGLGEKCRRQYVIGEYIVDFFFRKSLLIIELDGEYHSQPEQQKVDVIRQTWLEQRGYKVLRFRNEEVLCNIEKVIKTIQNNLKP